MNRHLKGFIASIVVIVLCAIVTIATFAQSLWYGVFPLALGIFFLIKFAIPSWREYKEETTPSEKQNPLLHNIPEGYDQRIRINRKEPSISKEAFFTKCEEIIRSYENTQSIAFQSCLSELMTSIKNDAPNEPIFEDLEKQPRFLLMNRSARLLSSGQYHFHAGSLTAKGESMYRVFNGCVEWLFNNNHLTQEEYSDCKKSLQENIKDVG